MKNEADIKSDTRTVTGKQVKQLRREGIIPAVLWRHHQASLSLQVNEQELYKLLARGGSNVILLKIGTQVPIQVLIRQVERDPLSRKAIHVSFQQLAAVEKLKAHVPLRFANEPPAASLGGATVSRLLNEVLVECLPADLPAAISVDLSGLREEGAMIRVGDLMVGPAVTIMTDQHEMVAGLHHRRRSEKEEAEEQVEAPAPAPEPSPHSLRER